MGSEDFSQDSFDTISVNRIADPFAHRKPQTGSIVGGRRVAQGEGAITKRLASPIDASEVVVRSYSELAA